MSLNEQEEFELLSLQRQRAGVQLPEPSLGAQATGVLKQAAQTALDTSPANLTKKFFQTDPATMQRVGGPILPIAGGMAAGPVGAAAGEFARQMTGTAFAPETVPQTGLGRAASVMGAGVMQEPKILEAIPGVPQTSEMLGKLASKAASKIGGGAAKAMQAFSGGRAGDFLETAKKGFSTYAGPSKEEAGQMMGKALEKLPGESVAPTMAEHIASAITPEASAGNKFLVDIGKRIDKGELIDARQALKAKQSLDDVIDTVPVWQMKRRAKLFDLKRTFDDVLSSQSGELKEASNAYRAGVLRDNMTKFLPVNKHGEYSRLAPMLTTLASSVGGAAGMHEGGAKGGVLGSLGPAAAMVALSPGVLGAGAASVGAAKQAINAIGQNPAARQVLLQVLQRLTQGKQAQ